MAKLILMLTTVTFALVCGGIPARAQGDSDDPAITRHWEEVQQNQGDKEDTGRMGHGMMRQCMRQCMAEDGRMGEGWRKHGTVRHGSMMGPLAMRIIFALMDRDGDGTVSLEEFQAAHERIFKAMDPDKDGTVSQEEMLDFMRGTIKSSPQH
jgi:Ca2+-binding EF-hand superfamily protein